MNGVKAFLLITLLLLAACQNIVDHPLYKPSHTSAIFDFNSYQSYVEKTKQHIEHNRVFLTSNVSQEVKFNSPFEVRPPYKPSKGILLIHGLGDSPWTFSDVSKKLTKQGLLVRTILLPGHGTRPADLIDAEYQDWQRLVAKHIALLKQEVGEVYLGGFSTGANLAYIHAITDDEIKGLLLFSPAFKSNSNLAMFASTVAVFKDWLYTGNPKGHTNYARYSSVPTNGFAQYYQSSAKVLGEVYDKKFTKPVFIALSEHDSVLDSFAIVEIFKQQFDHPNSRLMWFGHQKLSDQRIISINSKVAAMRVSTMSHMGLTYSPKNPYYGVAGSYRMCSNGLTNEEYRQCRKGNDVWYSAWGYKESGKVHARLTFNPNFELMTQHINNTLEF